MSLNKTLDGRYEGGWKNVQDGCMLCQMEKKTDWHIETPRFVIAEKLSGGPFIVLKRHTTQPSDEEENAAHRLVSLLYDEYGLEVRMNLVPNHYHAHIVTDGSIGLSDE